ncbi:hypothetical protein K4F52_006781 [Lecanicillium sp. MT-2017a]|nr:hypothetical protein K4F52_006781 [Lecanicillium sp. MT-2017a]
MKSQLAAVAAAATFFSLGSAATLDKTKYPTNVEIDLVFPAANKTYNIEADFPVVFAVQNADPFLTWKPYFHWEIRAANNTNGDRADGSAGRAMSGYLPPDIVDNMFYVAESLGRSTKLAPGQYTLNWTLTITACSYFGSLKSVKAVDYLTGLVDFSTVADGSGTDVDFTAECPVYVGSLQSDGVDSGHTEATGDYLICPFVDKVDDENANPCRAKMWKAMEECLNFNMTHFGTKEFDACQKAIDDAPTNLGEGPRVKESEKNDTGGESGGGNLPQSGDKEDGAVSAYGVSNMMLGVGAVAAFLMV